MRGHEVYFLEALRNGLVCLDILMLDEAIQNSEEYSGELAVECGIEDFCVEPDGTIWALHQDSIVDQVNQGKSMSNDNSSLQAN